MAWTVHILVYVFVMSSIAYRSGDGLNPFYYQYERTHSAAQFFNGRSIPRNRYQRIQPHYQRRTDSAVEDLQAESGSFKILNTFHKRDADEGTTSGAIVFPGPTSRTKAPIIDKMSECRKIGLCTDVPNFPSEEMNNLIDKLIKEGKTTFNIDKLEVTESLEIAERFGSEEQNIELCDSTEEVTFPKELMDEKGKLHLVVNSDEKPVQGIRTEVCRQQGPCKSVIGDLPRGYTASCLQKHSYRNFITYDKNNKQTEMVPLRVPTCCACVLNVTSYR